MVATAPSMVPRQVTTLASAFAFMPKGRTDRPAAAALMRMMRRRESMCVMISSSIRRSFRGGCVALRRTRIARSQHVVSRHIGEGNDLAAVFSRELLRGVLVRERHGFVASHPALDATADHEQRLSRLDPIVDARLVPAGR